MQSLGRPSEIIVLPHRDRIIPESARGEDGPQQNLNEALEQENAPVPWEQVMEHIEQTRAAVGKQRGPLDIDEWTSLKATLRRRFDRAQLKRYLLEKSPAVANSLEGAPRPNFPAIIATHIWGFQLPEPPVPLDKPAGNKANRQVTKRVTVKNDLFLFERDTEMGFKRIASSTGASISVNGNIATINGTPNAVNRAQSLLNETLAMMKEISLQGFGDDLLNDANKTALRSLLAALDEKHQVIVQRDGTRAVFKVRYFKRNSRALLKVRRELRLAVGERLASTTLVSPRPQAVTFAPSHAAAATPWTTKSQEWARAFDATASGSPSDAQIEGNEKLEKEWQAVKRALSRPYIENSRSNPNDFRAEFSARLGINRYHLQGGGKYTGQTAPTTSQSWFVDEFPLVAQLFADQAFEKALFEPGNYDIPLDSPLLYRVVLAPVILSSPSPRLEMYLHGADQNLGLCQRLNVARITAIQEENNHNFSLPTLPVDVTFLRQIKMDLFIQRSPSTSTHPALLQTIGEYLAKTRKQVNQVPDLPLFHNFTIPVELLKVTSSAKSPVDTEYVLESAEIVDNRCRLAPHVLSDGVKLPIEHTIFTGGRYGPDRQELRISEVPLLAAMRQKPVSLEKLRSVTWDVAERIAMLSKQLRRRMEHMR